MPVTGEEEAMEQLLHSKGGLEMVLCMPSCSCPLVHRGDVALKILNIPIFVSNIWLIARREDF